MPPAQKDLDGFSGKFLSKLENIILGLYDQPRPHNSKKLSGGGSQWRIRMGDYRIQACNGVKPQLSTIYPCNSFFKIFQALKAHLEPLLLCEIH
jgi:hypothetical protein